jgi:phage terminase small subunit
MANRVPTAVLDARGAYDNHPERRQDREHQPEPTAAIGNAPKHFTPEQKKIWREFVKIAPPGVLFNSDRWLLETLVILKTKERDGTISDTARAQMIACLAKLGMTPVDRSKVQAKPGAGKEKEKSPWDLLNDQSNTPN